MANSQQDNLIKIFLDAAKEQNINLIRDCISKNVSFQPDWAGYTALHFTSINGNLEIGKLLIKAGLSTTSTTKFFKTPLHLACENGHKCMVELLMNFNAKLECKDMLHMTPLHWACERGHIDVIKYLCENYKFDYNLCDKFNRTVNDILKMRLNTSLKDFLVVIKDAGSDDVVMDDDHMDTQYVIKSFAKAVSTQKPSISSSQGTSLLRNRYQNIGNRIEKVQSQIESNPKPSTSSFDHYVYNFDDLDRDENKQMNGLSKSLDHQTHPSKSLNTFMDETLYWLQNQIGYQNTASTANFLLDELKSGRELILTEAGRLTLAYMDNSESARNLLNKVKKTYENQNKDDDEVDPKNNKKLKPNSF